MTTWMTLRRRGFSLPRWKEKTSWDQALTLISNADKVSFANLEYWTLNRERHLIPSEAGVADSCPFTAPRITFSNFFSACPNGQHHDLIDFAVIKTLAPSPNFSFCQTWGQRESREGRRWWGLIFLVKFRDSHSILYYDKRKLSGEASKFVVTSLYLKFWSKKTIHEEKSVQKRTKEGPGVSEGILFWSLRLEQQNRATLTTHPCWRY